MGNHCTCVQPSGDNPEDPQAMVQAARNAKRKDQKQQKLLANGKDNPACVRAFIKDVDARMTSIPCVGGASWEYRAGAGGSGSRGNLTDNDMARLADRLSDSSQPHALRRVDLVSRGMCDGAAQALAAIMTSRNCSGITHLSVSHNNMTDVGAETLFHALAAEKCALQTLLMDGNSFGTGCLEAAADAFEANKKLESFDLCLGSGALPLQGQAVQQFLRSVAKCSSLKKLRVSGENARSRKGSDVVTIVEPTDLMTFFAKLAEFENTALKDISLTYLLAEKKDVQSEATMKAYASFAAMMIKFPSVTTLDFTGNLMGDRMATAIADVLSTASAGLTSLNLSKNNLTSAGLASIGQALQQNTSLTSLNISNQFALRTATLGKIGRENVRSPNPDDLEAQQQRALLEPGLLTLFSAITHNVHLQALVMTDVEVSETLAEAIIDCVEHNTGLADIRYASCPNAAQGRIVACLRANSERQANQPASGIVSPGGSCPDVLSAHSASHNTVPQLVFKTAAETANVRSCASEGKASSRLADEYNNTDAELDDDMPATDPDAMDASNTVCDGGGFKKVAGEGVPGGSFPQRVGCVQDHYDPPRLQTY